MTSFRDVFADAEMTNWLKAWLGLNITRAGLLNFVDNEMKQLKTDLYQRVIITKNHPATTACTSCSTANLLKCPIKGMCIRTGKTCTVHADPAKQYRSCPNIICDDIRDEIKKVHRFPSPSWKNTSAEQWTCNHWEVATCFMPPDGYTGVSLIQNTDFNGIINVLLNCKHFDTKFSFKIGSGGPTPCLLTKARDIGKAVRHSSTCKVTNADLKKFFIVFIGILTDAQLLAQDSDAREAVEKLQQLQTESLNIASEEMVQLLKDAQEVLIEARKVTQESKLEMKTYIDGLIKLNNRVDECEQKIQGLQTTMDSVNKTNLKETDYTQEIIELQRRLKQYYLDNLRHVPVSPLVPSNDKSLMEIYVTPKIHQIVTEKDGVKRKAGQIFKYKDIFQKDPKTKKHVFLQGEPGKGKTTFAAKLVSDWCNDCATTSNSNVKNPHFADVETLQAYTFVFHIALRESRCQRNLTEMIKKQIIEKIYAEKDVNAAYILLQRIFDEEICLVVQDGLDEWCDPDKELVLPFLAHTYQCIVLITTRPWKMSDERLKNSQIDCLLELEGVMDSSMLSKNILGCLLSDDLDSKHDHFETYVRENRLTDLVLTPMMLTHIVCLWVDGTILTGSTCEIYSLILDSFLKKNSNKWSYFQCPPFKCFENTKYLQPNYDHIQSISKAAFDLLFSLDRDGSLVFSDKVLYRYLSEEQKVFALNSGIISERKTSTLSFKPSTMSFIHKSIQEFLAAMYIALNVNVIDDVFSAYLSQTPDALLDISQVFIFVCGLNIGAANRMSSTMNSHFITYLNKQYRDTYMNNYRYYRGTYIRPFIRNAHLKGFQDMFITGFLEAKSNNFKDQEVNLQLHHFKFDIDENKHCALKSLLSDKVCKVQSLVFITYKYPDLRGYDVLSSSAHCLQYLQIGDPITCLHKTIPDTYTKLDLSLLQRLQDLHVYERYVELLPLCGVLDMKSLTLNCKCDGLDLQSFKNLRELDLGKHVTLVPNALQELRNLDYLYLKCMCDGLDLSSCTNLEDIRLGKHITLLPFALRDLHQVQKLNLECKCDGLDLSSFKNLRKLELGEHVTLVSNALYELNNLESLTLECKYDGLDLTSCKNLKDIRLGKHITLLPFALRDLHQVQKLNLNCKCDGLDLPSFKNLRGLELGKHVTLVPNALYELNNLESLSLECKYDGLDLTSCTNLKGIRLGKHITLLPFALRDLHQVQKLNLNCKCDGLDLPSFKNLRELKLGEHVTLVPNALYELNNMESLSLECKYDGLDLTSCKKLKMIILDKNVKLLPNALKELRHLDFLILRCMYDGLDLSSCTNLKDISLGEHITLLPFALRDLHQVQTLNLECKCDGLDLSSCTNLKDIRLGKHITLLPFALRDLHQVQTLNLECKCDGLDLPSFKNLRGLELGKHVTLVPNALYELNNLESLSLKCKYDGLDLTSFKKLKRIELDEHVKLLPNALQELRNLDHLDLRCMCDGLDLSSCTNLKYTSLGEQVTLLPNTLRELHNMEKLQLRCQYDGLELSLYRKLEKLDLGKKVTLLPCVLRDLRYLQFIELFCKCDSLDVSSCQNVFYITIGKLVKIVPNSLCDLPIVKFLTLICKYEGLDLSSCHSLSHINLGELVTLLPNSLRDLTNLIGLTLRCKCEGLDLSSCQNLLTLKIGKQVTLLPNIPENIRGRVSFVDDIDSDSDD